MSDDTPDLVCRATLEQVARGFTELNALQQQQRKTMALMLKVCLLRIASPDAAKRREGLKGLHDLLELLESKS